MRTITPQLTRELKGHVGSTSVSRVAPYRVDSFRALVEHIARLSYLNPDHLLFYRGQNTDFLNKAGSSTIYPGIYRSENTSKDELRHRFDILDQACRGLVDRWADSGLEGTRDIKQKRYVQWSILQHYAVVDTPLLDITHSLRVACSFAQQGSTSESAVVYVLGLPQVTNRISINSEDDLVNVRLLSICPPAALRPHFQEGFLAGTTDVTWDFDDKTDLDFRNRLIAKFEIPAGKEFWGTGFNSIPEKSLYPGNDRVEILCRGLKDSLDTELQAGELGDFMKAWTKLEGAIASTVREASGRNLSLREAINYLTETGPVSSSTTTELQKLRTYRNMIVHSPEKVVAGTARQATTEVNRLLNQLFPGRRSPRP
ncbi:conserved hypothetical protein [Mesorhizobium plurifarium]|uniref:FRG domain-containing protein n=1 Tax=Mesorhizobium plurifarium TaxID=69974 RepID=A0A0K2VZ44_MESPL|nr:conserved hypothetical protein [Mesorhizobium plurifarium]